QVGDLLAKCRGKMRFADARLAGEHRHLPSPGARPIPKPAKHRHLLLATNEWSMPGAQRLEPVLKTAFTNHLPDRLRFSKSFELVLAEIRILKNSAGELTRRRVDCNTIGFC